MDVRFQVFAHNKNPDNNNNNNNNNNNRRVALHFQHMVPRDYRESRLTRERTSL